LSLISKVRARVVSAYAAHQAIHARRKAVIELIFAGRDMAAHLVMQDGQDFNCVCGPITGPYENPEHHHNFCPVARFFAAVEAVRKREL